jgi:hypothetical protein
MLNKTALHEFPMGRKGVTGTLTLMDPPIAQKNTFLNFTDLHDAWAVDAA